MGPRLRMRTAWRVKFGSVPPHPSVPATHRLTLHEQSGALRPASRTCTSMFDTPPSRLLVQERSHDCHGSTAASQSPDRVSLAQLEDPLECPLAWAREANAYVCVRPAPLASSFVSSLEDRG